MRKSVTNSIRGIIGRALLLTVLAAVCALPRTADAAITRVQYATGDAGTAAATSFAVTLGTAPKNGNTLVAVISTRGTSASRVSSITQTGATWTRASQGTNTNGTTTEIWYAPNVSGAGSTVTITQASLLSAAVVMEYSGVLAASPLDQSLSTSAATAASTSASTGTTGTTTQASELAVGGIGLVNSGYTLGTPTNSFAVVGTDNTTNATAGNNAKVYALEKMLAATGTVSSGGTVSTSSFWSGTMATFKESAPVPGTVTITPSANGYISSAPTISTAFTSTWPLSGCQYTVNGGTNWSAGTVSGSAPSFTCTANPTGLSGSVTVNMRATSASTGTGTATAATRTVDSTNPADGTLTIYPGNPDLGLLWTAASDAGSGVDHYDLYYQTGATPPACGGGTLLYTGRNINYTHSGLAANAVYSYRLCATDKTGNVSTGAFGTATTTPRASAVNSCTSCHGYPPVDNAGRVGGSTGQFQGSHNRHAGTYGYDCTVCHVSNTTFSHARGTINMASPINGNTGAAYSKGTAPAVSNTFSPGYCSNTYCHSDGTSVSTGSIAANNSANWGGSLACNGCHGFPPQYASGAPKMNNHTTARGHKTATCDVCHSSVSYSGGTYTPDPTLHNAGSYSLKSSYGYVFSTSGGTCSTPGNGCHGPTPGTWGGRLGCIDCHSKVITRTKGRAAGTTLAAVTAEFGLAYGHKKAGRTPVNDDDCCVCHLEGDGVKHRASAYHQDGNIDLRDPWGAGETPITGMNGSAFTFVRFSTSYAAGSRTTTGHNNNADVAQVITLRFCIRCHSSKGATNPTARSNNGGTGNATSPWGGVNLGTNYTVLNGATANGASAYGGVVNVFSQFSTGNSSVHPVRGPLNRDFPIASRLAPPYNNQGSGRVAAGHTKSLSVVINCFDCHNSNTGTLLTLRTNSAHGTGSTGMVRGTTYVSGMTLCAACHTGYTSASNHGSGSAMNGSSHNDEGFESACYNCHSSKGTAGAPARPIAAFDYHGFNKLLNGNNWPSPGMRPYGFIRAWTGTAYHRPFTANTEFTTGSATCGSGTCPANGQVGDGSNRTYTPGGAY